MYLIILFGVWKNWHSSGWNHVKRVIKLMGIIVKEYYCYQLHTEFYPTFLCEG